MADAPFTIELIRQLYIKYARQAAAAKAEFDQTGDIQTLDRFSGLTRVCLQLSYQLSQLNRTVSASPQDHSTKPLLMTKEEINLAEALDYPGLNSARMGALSRFWEEAETLGDRLH